MPIADALKERTAKMHRFAETRPLQKALVTGKASRGQLAIYLAQLGQLHQTLEALLERVPEGAAQHVAALTQPHSHSIAGDLQALQEGPSILEITSTLTDKMRRHAAEQPLFIIGALYVLEGSMNGNRYIARGLASGLGLKPGGAGLTYWDPYGEAQHAHWDQFRKALDDLVLTKAEEDAVHDGASFMFEAVAKVSDASAEASGMPLAV